MLHQDQASPSPLFHGARLHPTSLIRDHDENLAVCAGRPDLDFGAESGVLDCIRRCLVGRKEDLVTDVVRHLYTREPRSKLSTQAA